MRPLFWTLTKNLKREKKGFVPQVDLHKPANRMLAFLSKIFAAPIGHCVLGFLKISKKTPVNVREVDLIQS